MASLSENRKAFFEYEILERFEAGIVLLGQEVKSIRLGRINLAGSYIVFKDEEPYLLNAHVPPYQPKNVPADYDPTKPPKPFL